MVRHIGFFYALMNQTTPTIESNIAEELARVASRLQEQRTGHPPMAVTVVLGEETLVVTLHGALTETERALSQTEEGAAQVQECHRQLFANSTDELLQEIRRLTGRAMREGGAEIEIATGSITHAFTTGAIVQVYLLTPAAVPAGNSEADSRADDDGMRQSPAADVTAESCSKSSDQNENKADIATTADIRQRVVETEMSVKAQNVKIITQDGKVTLRGPVQTEAEKQQVEAIALAIAGEGNVDNQLEVKGE